MTTEAQEFESHGRLRPVGHIKRFGRGAAGAASRLGSFLRAPGSWKNRGPPPVASVSSGQLLGGGHNTEPKEGYGACNHHPNLRRIHQYKTSCNFSF